MPRYFRAVSCMRLGRDRDALLGFEEIQSRYRGTRYRHTCTSGCARCGSGLQDPQVRSRPFRGFPGRTRRIRKLVPQALLHEGPGRDWPWVDPLAAAKDLESPRRQPWPAASRRRGVAVLLPSPILFQGRATEVLALVQATPADKVPEASRSFYRLYEARPLGPWGAGRRPCPATGSSPPRRTWWPPRPTAACSWACSRRATWTSCRL